MKTLTSQLALLLISLITFSSKINAQLFSINSPSGNYTLTCKSPVITMVANNGTAVCNYTWTGPSTTITTAYANVSQPGTWTVVGQNTLTLASSQITFAIYQDLTTPTVNVTPTVLNIDCSSSPGTFTGTSNLGPNVSTNWYIFQGTNTAYVGVSQGTINVWQPHNPGTYWFESINNTNGCSSTKSVLVTGSMGVPTFTLASSSNFTIGCGTTSLTNLQIVNVVTTPLPGNPIGYTIMIPPVTSSPTSFGVNASLNNISIPGLYVAYIRDLTNFCVSSQSINIIQNTVQPTVYLSQPVTSLTCKYAGEVMATVSSNSNTTLSWITPPNTTVNASTVSVVTNSTLPNSTVNIVSLGTYTYSAIDNNNKCVNTQTVQIDQDLRVPVFSIAGSSNSVITCSSPSVTLIPVISATLSSALLPDYTWMTPSSSTITATSLTTTLSGAYSATATSATNGCTSTANFTVTGNAAPTGATGNTFVTQCTFTSVNVMPNYANGTVNLTFSWTGPAASILSPTNQSNVNVNALGVYTCVVTNTISGCSDIVLCYVQCANGLINNESNSGFSVFPNPVSADLFITNKLNLPIDELLILDLTGKVVIGKKEIVSKINVQHLPPGFYILKLSSGDKTHMIKFIKD